MCAHIQPPYSQLRHICWGLLLNHNPAETWIGVMADYALYMDDSGHPDNQPFVVAAGFVATEQHWLAFEPEWNGVLDQYGFTEAFHMTDFMSRERSTKRRSAIIDDLTAVIRRHTQASFTGAVDVTAYRKINEEYALEECLGTPFAIASRGMAKEMRGWKEQNLATGDHFLLFAESGTKHRGDMAEVFRRDRLPEPHNVPKSMPAVQPADMLAWEMFNHLKTGKQYRRVQRLIGDGATYGALFSEQDLKATCVAARVPLRSEMPPDAPPIVFHSALKRPRRRTIKHPS